MKSREEKVIQWIDENKSEIVRVTCDLIGIRSVSGREDSNEQYEKAAGYFKNEFAKFGATVQTFADEPFGGKNVAAVLKGTQSNKTLGLGGHMDVVSADESDWNVYGFTPVVTEECIIGRGAADMKGGLACCLIAMKAIAESGVPLKNDIAFVATVDEEISSPCGMNYLMKENKLNLDYFVNAEQTDSKIITGYKGCVWVEVTVTGVTAHGSRPQLGVNAVEKAAKLICAMKEKAFQWPSHPFMGKCTVNIGTIAGGTAINVVPDTCKFKMDIRIVPEVTDEMVMQEINRIIDMLRLEDKEFHACAAYDSAHNNPLFIPQSNPLVKALVKTTNEVYGRPAELSGFIAAGDNRKLIEKGIPSIMFGPGSLDVIHKSNEYVRIDELVECCKVYALLALDLDS